MLKALAVRFLFCALVLCVCASTIVAGFSHCNCEDEGFWSTNNILECQKVSDFLIAVAYFSIPIELIYFISCSNVPFKWVLLQFIAFIVLCGLTHLLNWWTYYGPHSFQLMMSLTVLKFLTALVSCATSITLLTLIPLLLKLKVRELFLTQNVLELDQEVGMMKKKKEASLHVHMLTQEIRKSLDKHTILYTTLVELSKTLNLQNCAIWMLNDNKTEMNLTHELKKSPSKNCPISIPVDDPDVREIKGSKGVRILRKDSALAIASNAGLGEPGSVAAIRMPMLKVSNFKGGTPELVRTRYSILVLVLPSLESRVWSYHDLEIMEVVADQVAVALSHAAILEESQAMREKLREQNRALQQAKKNAMMASQTRNEFQKVMNQGMRRPMHSILGLLSMFQQDNISFEQRILVDTMVRTSNVLSTLIEDVMEIPAKDDGRFPFDMRSFHLHPMIKEAACLAKSLFAYEGFSFTLEIQRTLPDLVIGDERRAFQVILHMLGHLLRVSSGHGSVFFGVFSESGNECKNDKQDLWRPVPINEYINVKFEFEINKRGSSEDDSVFASWNSNRRHHNDANKGLSFSMCKKLAQMMQGNIWVTQNRNGLGQSMTLVLKFQLPPSHAVSNFHNLESSSEQIRSSSLFRGLKVVLADDDGINRVVTKKLLEMLGCQVTAVSSGLECLGALRSSGPSFQVVFLDLHMPELDGFEVAMRIREFHSRQWPLIVALTASAEDNIWERCLRVGMNGLIRKPVVLQGIADELRRVLERAKENARRSEAVH
ncbi:CUGBP Elav-like member 2 [Ancistrocladus abbreviatus]